MSRLTELIFQLKSKDLKLGADFEEEFKALSSRREFGLNFERHRPETVELPGRIVRKGDKVRILPKRGGAKRRDQQLWLVKRITQDSKNRIAEVESIATKSTHKKEVVVDDLVVVAEFHDYIYPGLVSTGKVERGNGKPFHTVINGENYHALKTLSFTHKGKIDVIYIDPPYNSGARDWKYNNDYVESDDLYRHSKWLAFMERRLTLANELLNPHSSALICSIDEKEYLRLGMLLEQVFPESKIQMVTSIINPKGVIRSNEFTRTNEFIYFVILGDQELVPEIIHQQNKSVRWASLRRFEFESRRHGPTPRLGQFYPIYINNKTGRIEEIGKELDLSENRNETKDIPGCTKVFPVKPDGTEMVWGVTKPTLEKKLRKGYVKVTRGAKVRNDFTIYYLTSGQEKDILDGKILVVGNEEDGSVILAYETGKHSLPTTQWSRDSHNAQTNGSNLLKALLPDRSFPFPKSLYAVEDSLRIVIGNNKEATVLDFFAGSGTTSHALMRLNKYDSGRRQCILVTNNEVSAEEQRKFREDGLRPGDEEWERWGICELITKPRIRAAITGMTSGGKTIEGDYKFNNEFPIKDGFEENAEFFTLTYQTPIAISHNLAFENISPLLWMRAGSLGRRITSLPTSGWEVADTYGLLIDLDKTSPFVKAIKARDSIRLIYIVTNDDRRFQSIVRLLPNSIEPVRLYESYLKNFQFKSDL